MSPGNSLIADMIEANREQLLKTWYVAVRSDPRVQSDEKVSEIGLIDHVPVMIEELCSLLRRGLTPTPQNSCEARLHVYTRFKQHYRIRDLVRETSLLRITLLDHIGTLAADDSSIVTLDTFIETSRVVNLYIDEELRYAVAIYTEAEKTDAVI
ncbi:MAG: hypothetical protein NVSMB56_03180 [Pyrinomonadaceae bacterium]